VCRFDARSAGPRLSGGHEGEFGGVHRLALGEQDRRARPLRPADSHRQPKRVRGDLRAPGRMIGLKASVVSCSSRASRSRWWLRMRPTSRWTVTPTIPATAANKMPARAQRSSGACGCATQPLARRDPDASHLRVGRLHSCRDCDEDAPSSWTDLAVATNEGDLTQALRQRAGGPPTTPAELRAQARAASRRPRDPSDARTLRSGSAARYLPIDVRDGAALASELCAVWEQWGPISGVVNGAGTPTGRRIVDGTDVCRQPPPACRSSRSVTPSRSWRRPMGAALSLRPVELRGEFDRSQLDQCASLDRLVLAVT
jgi:hypothetical protein